MKVTIHRGNVQIGGTCIELSDGVSRLVLDVGSPLDADLGHHSAEEIKPFLPKVDGLFKGDNQKSPDAVFISHSHPDHAAFLSDIKDSIKIYMSNTTKVVSESVDIFLGKRNKLSNIDIINGYHGKNPAIGIGDFKITPFDVDHSTPGSLAFVIEHVKENKTIVYTGDLRKHGKKGPLFDMFIKACKKSPDYMLMEGTMVGNMRTDDGGQKSEKEGLEMAVPPKAAIGVAGESESDLQARIVEELKARSSPVFTNFSMTNGDRLIVFLNACMKANKNYELVLDMATAFMYEKYKELNWGIEELAKMPIKILDIEGHRKRLDQSGNGEFLRKYSDKIIPVKDIFSNPSRVVLFKETQLRYFKDLKFPLGTIIMMSKWFEKPYPGQEDYYNDYVEFAKTNGIDIQKNKWHVSGHAYVPHLKELVDGINPKELIPIHTEHPEEFERVFAGHKIRRFKDGIPEVL